MKIINPNIYPKDGYFFKESDGTVHRGQSWKAVINRVIAYRRRQNRPVGNVTEEVVSQACSRSPNLCHEDSGRGQVLLTQSSLRTRVLSWLNWLRQVKDKGELSYVDEPLHDARADVCSRCPMDKSLPSGCGSCQRALKELHAMLVGGRKGDGRFDACPILGEYLPVSTWVNQETVANPALWVECWRKRTL